MTARSNTRTLTILAQDPAVRLGGRLAFAQVEVPYEDLAPGPTGHRVKVVDFDASADVLYAALEQELDAAGEPRDVFAAPEGASAAQLRAWEARLLADPRFHQQNVYAIVMRTLARFEHALGRRVAWAFDGHQLHVAPHAFNDANAYYSEADRALFFGWFRSARTGRPVFTCLSHDIVAHETTHALLDGLRDSFTEPSSPDQAAFHEGFADVVALLSVFSLREIVEAALVKGKPPARGRDGMRLVGASALDERALADSILFGLGKEFGSELEGARANCLRRSISLPPGRHLQEAGRDESHDRGEVFAAAMLRSFLAIWTRRIRALGIFVRGRYNLDMVVEEGATAAAHLLTMAIRALDYCPPVDLEFGDFLAALLTVDTETVPDDSKYGYRPVIRRTFQAYGIDAPAAGTDSDTGCWLPFTGNEAIVYTRTNYESMLHDPQEVFRFLWENRRVLRIDDRGYMRIASVRRSSRQGPDGFQLRETICEYVQMASIFGAEARTALGIERPQGMPSTQRITAYGGGTLVFDQYGRIKYHVEHRLDDGPRQSARLAYLWENGLLDQPGDARGQFAAIHRRRAGG